MHQENTAAKVVFSGEGSNSSKHAEKNIMGARKVPVFVLSVWEDAEDDMVGGEGWDEEENGGEGGLCCKYWWYAGPRGCLTYVIFLALNTSENSDQLLYWW